MFNIFLVLVNILIPAFFIVSALILYRSTLIDSKIFILIGSIGMIILPILMKDLVYKFSEWHCEHSRGYSLTEKERKHNICKPHWILTFPIMITGFGLFLSAFLFFNLTIPTSNITESIQIPILKVRTTYRHRSREPNGKEATVQIKNYIKDINFPLESEIKEGQLLNFWVRKGYFGFDIFKKL